MKYGYASGDLLDHPQSYRYSSYCGPDLFIAWREQREKLLTSLGSSDIPPEKLVTDVLAEAANSEQTVLTATRLSRLIVAVSNAQADRFKHRVQIAPWIKTFEVRKKIYSEYDDDMRPGGDGNYRELGNYVLYAFLMERAWSNYQELPYLNVFFKVVDSICSFASSLGADEKSTFCYLLSRERQIFDQQSAEVELLND